MFQIQCDNRKCMKLQAPQLDISTDQVICQECGSVITNVTIFAKRQLKSLGQTNKNQKSKQSYATKCNSCKAIAKPILINNVLCCQTCSKELTNISQVFKNLVINALKEEPSEDEQ